MCGTPDPEWYGVSLPCQRPDRCFHCHRDLGDSKFKDRRLCERCASWYRLDDEEAKCPACGDVLWDEFFKGEFELECGHVVTIHESDIQPDKTLAPCRDCGGMKEVIVPKSLMEELWG
jgi:hypothetical protein